MTHTALARKYRPTRFADLVGQEHIAAGLAGAVARNRVAHAYLLTGPRGVGKTSAARILAMVLNCAERTDTGEPCGECESCQRIWSGGANLDVVEIDAASNRGVDDARDLRERAMYAASGPDRHKVYIVDEAHMLTREAWNALLKILEEPPPRVVFVFATTDPQKIANTAAPVLSRVQRFDFRRIGSQAIVERMRYVAQQEEIAIEDGAVALIARVAAGGMRDALSLLDQALVFGEGEVTVSSVRDGLGIIGEEAYADMLDLVAARDSARVFRFVEQLAESGADLAEFLSGAGDVLRSLMRQNLGVGVDDLGGVMAAAVERHAARFPVGDALRMLKLLAEVELLILKSPHPRLHVEALLVQWTLMDRTVELAEVIDALGRPSAANNPETSSREPSPRPPPPPPPPPPAVPPLSVPQTVKKTPGSTSLAEFVAAWPRVVELVSQRRRVVQEALAGSKPVDVSPGNVTLSVPGGTVHVEGLKKSRSIVENSISEVVGEAMRVIFQPEESANEGATEPRRRDQRSDRDERLRRYRDRDKALDAAADALDLELLD